jgi:hypothetical protein
MYRHANLCTVDSPQKALTPCGYWGTRHFEDLHCNKEEEKQRVRRAKFVRLRNLGLKIVYCTLLWTHGQHLNSPATFHFLT